MTDSHLNLINKLRLLVSSAVYKKGCDYIIQLMDGKDKIKRKDKRV